MPNDDAFAMKIESKWRGGREKGLVVAGTILRGTVRVGDHIEVAAANGTLATTVLGIEVNRTRADAATAGENVALLLLDVDVDAEVTGSTVRSPA